MDFSHFVHTPSLNPELQKLLGSLPRRRGWSGGDLYQYQGFWYPAEVVDGILAVQQEFQARDTDVILATAQKSGTTWLKSLVFSILNRRRYSVWDQDHPLLRTNPHGLVLTIDYKELMNILSDLPPPRLISTHIEHSVLPESVKTSSCKIIYLCRNPKDVFVSLWFFMNKGKPDSLESLPLDDAFEMFCEGASPMGPVWDQALGYWKLSIEKPDKVLFLMYEDMKHDIVSPIQKIAEFLGYPFSAEEEKDGVIQQIARMCSFEQLRNLGVNKDKETRAVPFVDNNDFFRKGQVGDWINYLTPSMAERLDRIAEKRLHGSGLSFS